MTGTMPVIIICFLIFGATFFIVWMLRKREQQQYNQTHPFSQDEVNPIPFETPVEDEPTEDSRIQYLTEKIANYQKQLRYWKGDVLKEAECTGLINKCQRSIDNIRRRNGE